MPWQHWKVADSRVSRYVIYRYEVDGEQFISAEWLPKEIVEDRYAMDAIVYLYGFDRVSNMHVLLRPLGL